MSSKVELEVELRIVPLSLGVRGLGEGKLRTHFTLAPALARREKARDFEVRLKVRTEGFAFLRRNAAQV